MKNLIEVCNVPAPAKYASAFINGDFSGLSKDEKEKAREIMDSLSPWYIVGDDGNGEYVGKYEGEICSMMTYVMHRIIE